MSKHKNQEVTAPTRFAIYCRYSDEVQNDISLESQEAMCREAIIQRNGVVVGVYKDAAQFGWSLDREGFARLRTDAERQHIEAVMMWKFDRLARDHTQVTMIKALLRHEYDVRLYCVEGFSEDDDNSPYTAMMEQMLAVFSAFYSKNLSTEIKRANRHRHATGKFNGGKPPFGYLLATEKTPKRANCFKATAENPTGLHIEPNASTLVHYAFTLYASGDHSYATTARALTEKANTLGYPIEKPFNPHMIRELLQNKVYCGYVGYVETIYRKGFGQSKASGRGRREWAEGNHDAIISEALFEKVQAVRSNHAVERKNSRTTRHILLSGLVYCARCLATMPPATTDEYYGKLYSYSTKQRYWYYECSAKRRGYVSCGQPRVPQATIDEQVITALRSLHTRLPEDVSQRVEAIIRQHAQHAAAAKQMDDISEIVERIDFSWENGFMDEQTYVKKRRQLQIDIEMLRPLEQDDLLQSANLLKDFDKLWVRCSTDEEKHALIKQIIERVIVIDDTVIALVLRGDTAMLVEPNTAVWNYREGGTRTLTSLET